MLIPGEDGLQEESAVQNGCQDERKGNGGKASAFPSQTGELHHGCIVASSEYLTRPSILPAFPQAPAGRSPKALNGLLSPHAGQALANSQTSLCEMLQEKEMKLASGCGGGGGGTAADVGTMDHSALIPLRSKNFRERSDAHFVDVIKEDR